ncbi:hypothetical protein D3C72_2591600 [compost metagenome]
MMLRPMSEAKSPRIEPVADWAGLVAPIMARAVVMTFLPSHAMATMGPEVMKSTRPAKKGLPLCSP